MTSNSNHRYQALREIREAAEAVLGDASVESPEPAPSEARLLEAFRTIDLLCRAQLPGKYRHKVVHRSPGPGMGTSCGVWTGQGLETTNDSAAVTCKLCRRGRS